MSEAVKSYFFDRDISWLSFNERVLLEAGKQSLPIGERIHFLSIYSSNLDEFYRVRIPALMALYKIDKEKSLDNLLADIKAIIDRQQQLFGILLLELLTPLHERHNIVLLYNQALPEIIRKPIEEYFFTQIMAFLQPVYLSDDSDFFPENNKGYLAVSLDRKGKREIVVVNIPSEFLTRFFSVTISGIQYIVFLDDIILESLKHLFPATVIYDCHSFKITRDAELDLTDEYGGDLAEKMEKQLLKRDMGFATRFLYDGAMPETDLKILSKTLSLKRANQIPGGRYHNLKDLAELPIGHDPSLFNEKWLPTAYPVEDSVFKQMQDADFMLHVPYQSYQTVLRFFNEAALDEQVSEIFITVYRIAHDSHIAQALISAAKNGKKVTVFVELKARFDEANNIHWAKKMKSAGVKIIYSIPGWKVHAKVALVKRKKGYRTTYYGLLATGNFNESTARFYADHILFTANKEMLRDLELLFIFLSKRKKIGKNQDHIAFHHLLITQFNLQSHFIHLINEEIKQAEAGEHAAITIKLNNLEEEVLINKLYEASNAGVKIQLIVRSICRLVPGVKDMSENISIHRIVDRYLEHGRIFIFYHKGNELIFAGSADWMSRNIYRRIEACFPVYDAAIRQQLKEMIRLELADNTQAVFIDKNLNNIPIQNEEQPIQAQKEIYQYLEKQAIK